MRLAGITKESFVDGPGVRLVIFAQGCFHGCTGCHNPDSHDVNGGSEYTTKEIMRTISKVKKRIRGITISGGEPFLQAAELSAIAAASKQLDLDVVTYTGFTYEQIIKMQDEPVNELLNSTDILIDGKFQMQLRDISLMFCGSANQRIIDVAKTKNTGNVVLWNE